MASYQFTRESITPLLFSSKLMAFSNIDTLETCKFFSAWTSPMISRLCIQLESSPGWSLETMPQEKWVLVLSLWYTPGEVVSWNSLWSGCDIKAVDEHIKEEFCKF